MKENLAKRIFEWVVLVYDVVAILMLGVGIHFFSLAKEKLTTPIAPLHKVYLVFSAVMLAAIVLIMGFLVVIECRLHSIEKAIRGKEE